VAETTGAIMSRGEVLELVRSQLAEILEIDMSEINESSSFADDLDADSLALIELVEALERSSATDCRASVLTTRISRTFVPCAMPSIM